MSTEKIADKIKEDIFNTFMEGLGQLDIQTANIPKKIQLPNWPEDLRINIKLDKKNLEILVRDKKTGLWKKKKINIIRKIKFQTDDDGAFSFDHFFMFSVHDFCYSSGDKFNKLSRANAVFLFYQFQEEILTKILRHLIDKVGEHNEIVERVKKILEKFQVNDE